MRKNRIALLVAGTLSLGLLFSGCSGNSAPAASDSETLKGTSEAVLTQVTETAAKTLDESAQFPKTLTDPVTAENASGMLGLDAGDFELYAENATSATGAITTMAFEIAVVKCKDTSAAAEAREKIAAGFDSGKWICVAPEQSLVVSAGSYILLAVGSKAQTEALDAAFAKAAGDTASVTNVFYQKGDAPVGDVPAGSGADTDVDVGALKPL